MAKEEPNVRPTTQPTEGPTSVSRGVIRSAKSHRILGEYSHQVVYSQESIRLLDLRLTSRDGIDLAGLREFFGTLEGRILRDVVVYYTGYPSSNDE